MYIDNNVIYPAEGKLLKNKFTGATEKQHVCAVTFWSASGERLAAPTFESVDYFEEVVDTQAIVDSLKGELAASDYKILKYVEGAITEEEFKQVKAERQQLRDAIEVIENPPVEEPGEESEEEETPTPSPSTPGFWDWVRSKLNK